MDPNMLLTPPFNICTCSLIILTLYTLYTTKSLYTLTRFTLNDHYKATMARPLHRNCFTICLLSIEEKYYGADIYWLKYFHLIFAWNIFGGSKSGVCWIFGWKYFKSGWSPPWWAGLNCSPRIVLTVSTPVIGDCYHCYLIHCPPDIKLALYINNHYNSRHS